MKKYVSLLLAILMLASSASLLIACGGENESGSGAGEIKQYEEDSIFYERSLVSDDLPEKDYGGRVFRVVAHNRAEFEIPEEKRNQGDLIMDAKYARNQAVENRFNVKIEVVYGDSKYQQEADYVTKTVLAGNDEFDLFCGMVMSMGGVIQKRLFLNWYDIENIDFSKPWWYESNSTELTHEGKSLIAISHLDQSAVGGAYCMYFNKALASSYELGDIYRLVLDGNWTFDKLAEMVKDIYTDDGNGERDINDFYGMVQCQGTAINAYLWAFDNSVCSKGTDGIPQISVKTDKISSIVSDMYEFCYNNSGVYFDPAKSNGEDETKKVFYAGKAIFQMGQVISPNSKEFRDLEFDYGLIPLPKYDESQKNYMTMVGGQHTALAIPKTCKDTEFVGTIVEALSAESWKTVTPTLYEIALKTRYLRDSQSKEIMDMVIEGTQFDFGTVYDNWLGFAFMLEKLMRTRNSNFESYYQKNLGAARYQLKTTLKIIEKTN